MKDYQQKRVKAYLLPEPVYRQALWAVKDLPRMKEKLVEMRENLDCVAGIMPDIPRTGASLLSDVTGRKASDMVNLSMRIKAIEGSLSDVPEEYREGIINKLAYGGSYGDEAHINTWKKWQQIYLYHVAKNLKIM